MGDYSPIIPAASQAQAVKLAELTGLIELDRPESRGKNTYLRLYSPAYYFASQRNSQSSEIFVKFSIFHSRCCAISAIIDIVELFFFTLC